MPNDPDRPTDRGREAQVVVNAAVTTLPGVYLVSGSLPVTALAAGVLVTVVIFRRR